MFADIVHAHHLLAHPVLQRLDEEEAGGRDADGDMYYGGSMYYGNGKVEGAGAVRTWFANVAKCESAVSPTCDFLHLLLPALPVQLLRLTFAIGTLPGTRCGFRKCDPYEWRRDEDSLERNLWYGPCPRVAHKQAVSAKLRHLSMQPCRDVTVQEGLAQC